MVVEFNKLADALLELTRQVVVLQQNSVFHRSMKSFDLALCHRMIRPTADVVDALVIEPVAKLAGDIESPLAGGSLAVPEGWPKFPALKSFFYSFVNLQRRQTQIGISKWANAIKRRRVLRADCQICVLCGGGQH